MRGLQYLLLFVFGLVGACGLGLSVMKSQFGSERGGVSVVQVQGAMSGNK